MTMTTNPLFSTNHVIVLFVILAAVGGWVAWRTAWRCWLGPRLIIVVCRVALILCLGAVALNPGRWIEEREEQDHFWEILIDRSLSMSTADIEGADSRWQSALQLANAAKAQSQHPDKVKISVFSADLETGADPSALNPDGDQSDLPNAVSSLLSRAQSQTDRLTGAIVLTDGRQTAAASPKHDQKSRRVALRARAQESPVLALALGGDVAQRDLSVSAKRRQFVAFAGQQTTVTAVVIAEGLGSVKPEIALESNIGLPIDSQTLELSDGEEQLVSFTIDAPSPGVHPFRFRLPAWEGERIAANNEASFTVTVLDGKMNIFMAEGAPYWDSKFLSQMIRQQENMLISSVYRLSADRYFRVETGDERPSEATDNIFPNTREEMNQYDLIVLGKGAEYFLNPNRIALLDEFVDDYGGALLFTRGKPYSGEFDQLAFLEPVRWGERTSSPFRLEPTESGVATGLFGGLLPGPGEEIWEQLPPLREAHTTLSLKPFAQVLLEGRPETAGLNQRLPVLVSRRYGNGQIVLLNADGLWKWDFFPSKEGLERQYETFWSQLIQWAVTYSDFLPGQDLALQLSESIVYADAPVRGTVLHRSGAEAAGVQPVLEVFRGDERISEVEAIRPTETSVEWETSISLAEPGSYRVRVVDRANPDALGPSLPLTILPQPSEGDELSADPDFLKAFAEASGGRLITAEELSDAVAELDGKATVVDLNRAEWEPAWDTWWALIFVLFFPALEWFTRRRSGLL